MCVENNKRVESQSFVPASCKFPEEYTDHRLRKLTFFTKFFMKYQKDLPEVNKVKVVFIHNVVQ